MEGTFVFIMGRFSARGGPSLDLVDRISIRPATVNAG
jgi:hypothetical protein